jgi:hypothetical protein
MILMESKEGRKVNSKKRKERTIMRVLMVEESHSCDVLGTPAEAACSWQQRCADRCMDLMRAP